MFFTHTAKQKLYLISNVFNCQFYTIIVIRLYIISRYRLLGGEYIMDLDR